MNLAPVRVNLVAPGLVSTEVYSKMTPVPAMLEGFKAGFADATLTGELGNPEDVAEAVVCCMLDRFLDGHVILNDGGMLLGPRKNR